MITNWTDIIVGSYYKLSDTPSIIVKVLSANESTVRLKFMLTNISTDVPIVFFMAHYTLDTDYVEPVNGITMRAEDLVIGCNYENLGSTRVVFIRNIDKYQVEVEDLSTTEVLTYTIDNFLANYKRTATVVFSSKNSFKKDEQDKPSGKPIPGALDIVFLNEVAKVLAFGATKYGRDNWKQANPKQRILYVDAMFRHIFAALRGEQKDEESGCYHWAHAVCNIMFLFHWRKKK